MRAYKIFSLLLTLSLLMAFLPVAQAAPAPQPPAAPPQSQLLQDFAQSACSNLDVIFIVDQSDSMSTAGLASDPLENRKNAIKSMIDLLIDLTIDQCSQNSYRAAVISFGNQGSLRVDLPLSNIDVDSFDAADALRDKLIASLKADQLGQTYPKQGFREAHEILTNASTYGNEPRKKVIIFLTDGIPCSEGANGCSENRDFLAPTQDLVSYVNGLFPFNSVLLDAEQCLANLRERYGADQIPVNESNDCLHNVPSDKKQEMFDQSTYIYTILLKSEVSYPANVLTSFENMSHQHAGRLVELKRNLSEIPSEMRKILSELIGIRPNLLACGKPFAVNPYWKRLRVTVYNVDESNRIVLSYNDANGVEHSIKAGSGDGFTLDQPYYSQGVSEKYVFAYPYPGKWFVTADRCDGVDVYAEAIDFSLENQSNVPESLPQYEIEPFYFPDQPFYLEYQMKSGGSVIEQAPQSLFVIDANAEVTIPNQETYTVPLKYDASSKKFIATEPFKTPVSGVYTVMITGKSFKHEGDIIVQNEQQTDREVFSSEYDVFKFSKEFSVFSVTPVQLESLTPQAQTNAGSVHATILGGWPLKVLPLQVRVRLTGEDGAPFTDPQAIFKDPNQAMQAKLLYQPEAREGGEEASDDETATSAPVFLAPDPAVPGEFVASFPDFEHEGAHSLVLTIDRNQMQDGYWPYRNQTTVEFARTDCLFCRANTYYVILGLIIAFIAALIAYNILIRTNKVAGTLYFKDGATNLAEFGLYNGTNFRVIGRRELDSLPHLGLKRFKVYNTGKRRRNAQQQDAVTGGYYGEESLGVTIDYVTLDGRRAQVNLDPGFPVSYSEETIAQMVYEPAE